MLRRLSVVALLVASVATASCTDPPPPIAVEEGMVTVLNQTEHDWKEVLIVVNDHFRGFIPVLKAEGRANAPVSQMTTGHGQRWAPGTRVRTVDVTAKSADGSDVKLSWGREEAAR